MLSFRRSLLLVLGILPMFFVVACGGTPQTSTNSSSAHAAMTTQTAKPADIQQTNDQHGIQANNTQHTQGNRQVPPVTTNTNNQHSYQANSNQSNLKTQNNSQVPPATSNTLISVKQVNVHGQIVTMLTTFTGMTLYERTSDPAPGSNCTGQCARMWPPLLSNGTVISTAPIGGNLTVHLTVNGKQVEYNGHPLYTYSGDTAPGQTNGQGMGNVWQIIPVVLQRQHW
jgi:predicted lipoprotein with Yx(FWY)xxD motif